MTSFKFSFSRFASLGVLSLGLLLSPSLTDLGQSVQDLESQLSEILDSSSSAEFWSSRGLEGKPIYRESGGTRGEDTLTALVPRGYVETTQDYPTIFWYLPEMNQAPLTNTQMTLELTLYEGDTPESLDSPDAKIYSIQYPLTHPQIQESPSSGIKRLELSDTGLVSTLKPGKFYQWQILLSIDGDARDSFVSGFLQRVEKDSELTNEIEQASLREQFLLYAQAGLWNETLDTLYNLREANPNNPELTRIWEKLIASGNFTPSTEEFLIEQVQNSEQQIQ